MLKGVVPHDIGKDFLRWYTSNGDSEASLRLSAQYCRKKKVADINRITNISQHRPSTLGKTQTHRRRSAIQRTMNSHPVVQIPPQPQRPLQRTNKSGAIASRTWNREWQRFGYISLGGWANFFVVASESTSPDSLWKTFRYLRSIPDYRLYQNMLESFGKFFILSEVFNPMNQCTDGLSLYEYVQSNPVSHINWPIRSYHRKSSILSKKCQLPPVNHFSFYLLLTCQPHFRPKNAI